MKKATTKKKATPAPEKTKEVAAKPAARRPLTKVQAATKIVRGRTPKAVIDEAYTFRLYLAAQPVEVVLDEETGNPTIKLPLVRRRGADVVQEHFRVTPECYDAELRHRKGGQGLHYVTDSLIGCWQDKTDELTIGAVCVVDNYSFVKGVSGDTKEVLTMSIDADTGAVIPANFPTWARAWDEGKFEKLVQLIAAANSVAEGDSFLGVWRISKAPSVDGSAITIELTQITDGKVQ